MANIQQQKMLTAPIMTAVLLVTVKLWHFWGSDDGELLLIGLLPAGFSLGRRIIILYNANQRNGNTNWTDNLLARAN